MCRQHTDLDCQTQTSKRKHKKNIFSLEFKKILSNNLKV